MITDLRAIRASGCRMHDYTHNEYRPSCFNENGVYIGSGVSVRRFGTDDESLPDAFVPKAGLALHEVDLELPCGWYIDGVYISDVEDWILDTDEILEHLPDDEIIDDIRWSHDFVTVLGVRFYYDELIEKLHGEDELWNLVRSYRADQVRDWSFHEIMDFANDYDLNLKYVDISDAIRFNEAHKAGIRGTWPC